MFAQEALRPDEVARELKDVQDAIGSSTEVRTFVTDSLVALGAAVTGDGRVRIDLAGTPRGLRDAVGADSVVRARFDLPIEDGELYLTRTAPFVDGLASYVMDTALDKQADGIARRCGAIRTDSVATRTTLLLLRFRFDVITRTGDSSKTQLAEDCGLLAFDGGPDDFRLLEQSDAEVLLSVVPTGNLSPEQATQNVARVVAGMDRLTPQIEDEARRRAIKLLSAHERVRAAARATGVKTFVEPKFPVDVLGIYVFVPQPRP
jgi:hypothetical protein